MFKILCIDDNRFNSRLIKKYLSRLGFDVYQAETAWQGLLMAQEELVQLILVDVDLPDMDGLELIRRLKADAELAQTPIIPMVNRSKSQTQEYCDLVGCKDVLDKPIIAQELYNTVRFYVPEAFEEIVWFSEV